MASRSVNLWSDSELVSAVEAYVFLLRLERRGLGGVALSVTDILLTGPLKGRNEASVRYRMRNISAVVSQLGGPTLKAYSPAERVGTGVRVRLREILANHRGFQEILASEQDKDLHEGPITAGARKEALRRLATLRDYLSDLERELIGIGHNQPPEPLNIEGPEREDFVRAHEDIRVLEAELKSDLPDREAVSKRSGRLLSFGMKVTLWLSARLTKFVDASLVVLAPVAVAKATNLLPVLESAIGSVLRAILP